MKNYLFTGARDRTVLSPATSHTQTSHKSLSGVVSLVPATSHTQTSHKSSFGVISPILAPSHAQTSHKSSSGVVPLMPATSHTQTSHKSSSGVVSLAPATPCTDVLGKPVPVPGKTCTLEHGYGFSGVQVRVALENPRVTRANP